MPKFVIVEEIREKSMFNNFAIINAKNNKEAKKKYLEQIDPNPNKTFLSIFNVSEMDDDYYHFYEIET